VGGWGGIGAVLRVDPGFRRDDSLLSCIPARAGIHA
jgi:hypothetical protein